MAVQLIFTPNYAFAEGVFAPGAKVSFFLSGTTTPQTVYSDEALTVAHPAPLVADASGQFATVWADNGLNIKAVVTDADDSTIATYDPVVLGNISSGDSGTTSFTPIPGNGATTVQQAITNNTTLITNGFDEFLEIPPLAGNGGKVVAVKADASDIELVNRVPPGSRIQLATGDMADTITFTSLMNAALYVGYEIEYIATGQVSGGVAGELVVSSDNGANWDTGASDYSWRLFAPGTDHTATSVSAIDNSIVFTSGISWGATAVVQNRISIMRPDLSQLTNITMDLHKTEPGGGNVHFVNKAFRDSASAINALEIRGLNGISPGAVTGTYYFYGIAK